MWDELKYNFDYYLERTWSIFLNIAIPLVIAMIFLKILKNIASLFSIITI